MWKHTYSKHPSVPFKRLWASIFHTNRVLANTNWMTFGSLCVHWARTRKVNTSRTATNNPNHFHKNNICDTPKQPASAQVLSSTSSSHVDHSTVAANASATPQSHTTTCSSNDSATTIRNDSKLHQPLLGLCAEGDAHTPSTLLWWFGWFIVGSRPATTNMSNLTVLLVFAWFAFISHILAISTLLHGE